MAKQPDPIPFEYFDLELLARDILKRQKNYPNSTNDAVSKELGIPRRMLIDAQDAKPLPVLETLLLCRWARRHPYRYLKATPETEMAYERFKRSAAT